MAILCSLPDNVRTPWRIGVTLPGRSETARGDVWAEVASARAGKEWLLFAVHGTTSAATVTMGAAARS